MANPELGERMLTLVQVSDLHIGELDPATGNAQLSPAMVPIFANFTIFDGVLGHHALALEELDHVYWNELAAEKPYVIMTGDLTQIGRPTDFQTGAGFLASKIQLRSPNGAIVGLSRPNWVGFGIPGNHDHWPGLPVIWGAPTAGLAACFGSNPTPFVRDLPLTNGRRLRLAGINTDADVNHKGHKRARAVGSFQSQLATLAGMLGRPTTDEVRVLLMHHSWLHRGWLLSIDRGSRGALHTFIQTYGIQVVMTGHTHSELVQHDASWGPARMLMESRCGTTCQADSVPWSWKTLLGAFPIRKWPKNTFLVHRLYKNAAGTTWESRVYVRDIANGFEPLKVSYQWQV